MKQRDLIDRFEELEEEKVSNIFWAKHPSPMLVSEGSND